MQASRLLAVAGCPVTVLPPYMSAADVLVRK